MNAFDRAGLLRSDPVGLAGALALVSGIAAIVYPPFSGLSIALVALGVGAFLVDVRRRYPVRLHVAPRVAAALVLLGGLGAFALLLPISLAPLGPPGLGVGVLVLWRAHRTETGPREEPRR
ncbi:MAG: hypothetical protein ACREB9_01065 [Thermoplasmata archaeon]